MTGCPDDGTWDPCRGGEQVTVTDSSGGSLQDLYEVAYPRLVGVVGAVARDRHEAEEAVQDAFVRLMGCWDAVSRYDDPKAWVRKAALGFLSNRRRKTRNGGTAAE